MAPFGLFGGAEVILIALFYSGVGVPLGVPPEEPDPLLLKVAPDECLYYTTWAGMAKADPSSDNHTEQLLAEPEVQNFVSELETRFNEGFAKLAEKANTPEEKFAAELAPVWGKTLLTRPTAVFLSHLEIHDDGPPDMKAGAVVNTGEQTVVIRDSILKLQEQHLKGKVEEVEISGTKCYRFRIEEDAPLMTWGIRGRYLLIGLGEGAIEEIFANAVTPQPVWLTQMQRDLKVDRVSTLTYANIRTSLQMVLDAVGPEAAQAEQVIASLGLNSLTSYQAVAGLDGDGFTTRTMIGSDDELRGILKLAEAKPLTAADVESIPADSTFAAALRLDGAEVLNLVEQVGKEIDPSFGDQLDEGLRTINEMIGIRVREEILAGLGDTWCIYNSPSEGGLLFTGITATVDIRDHAKVKGAYDQLIAMAEDTLKPQEGGDDFGRDEWEVEWERRNQPVMKKMQVGNDTIYYITVGNGMPFAPAWCLTEEHLVVSLFPQNIQSMLSRGDKFVSMAKNPAFADVLNAADPPISLSYVDTRKMFEMFYPMLLMGAQGGFAAMEHEMDGLDIDISFLPSAASIGPHLQPGTSAMRRTAAGIEMAYHQSLPGASTGSTAPVMVALLLPAIQAARTAARRNASLNNLRQIGLAMLNYESALSRFPAQASKTADDKPGLSWRVAILPYIEEGALYEKFNHDEPWDSEHNLKLLEQMPASLRSPISNAEPGHTTYVAVTGKEAVIQGVGHKEGKRIREITDGTSNTIMVVEVNDEHAVPWTKPEDWEYDAMAPTDAFEGIWPGDIFQACFADCHVQAISTSVDPKVLKGLLTMNGGEAVRAWDLEDHDHEHEFDDFDDVEPAPDAEPDDFGVEGGIPFERAVEEPALEVVP